MNTRFQNTIIILVLLIIVFSCEYLMACGCTQGETEGTLNKQDDGNSENRTEYYKRFVYTEDDVNFMFDYPESYKDCKIKRDAPSPVVTCSRWANDGYFDSGINIIAWSIDEGMYKNPEEVYKNDIKNLKEFTPQITDVKIEKRGNIEISGIDALLVECSYIVHPDRGFDESGFKESTVIVLREAYFEYAGYIWELNMMSIEKVADEDEAAWEHLVDSFTFLD